MGIWKKQTAVGSPQSAEEPGDRDAETAGGAIDLPGAGGAKARYCGIC